MKIGARTRWFGLIALLALVLWAARWVQEDRPSNEVAVAQAPARSTRAAPRAGEPQPKAADRVQLDRLRVHEPAAEDIEDAFAPRSWRKPAPPSKPAPPAPPPAPTAPPLPFTYMGKLFSEKGVAVFLTSGDRNLIVREGDTIDSIYKAEQIAGARLILIHLPTGTKQTLAIGALP